jgi:hypothetical protein
MLELPHRLVAGMTTTAAKVAAHVGELTIDEQLGIPAVDVRVAVGSRAAARSAERDWM